MPVSDLPGEKAERIGKAMMLGPDWKELDRGVLKGRRISVSLLISKAPELEQEIRTASCRI